METDRNEARICEGEPEQSCVEGTPPEAVTDTAADEPPNEKTSLFRRDGFLSVGIASVLYMLSALSIMYGIATLIGPVLARSGVLRQTMPCIGALNLYESALLAVLLAIVILRKATADAVSLTVLVALFLAATGIALDTVANDSPPVAALVAAACFALAWVKLGLLRTYAVPALRQGLFSGTCVVAGWGFLTAPALAAALHYRDADAHVLRTILQAGWFVMLVGTVLMFLQAVRTGNREARSTDGTAFLRTHGMAWVFVGLVVAAAAVHQYALTYVFDVPWTYGDYLPLVLVVSLAGLELLRGYGVRSPGLDVFLAGIPLAGITAYMLAGREAVPSWLALDILWQPAVLTALSVVALVVLSFRAGRFWLAPVGGLYGLAFLLLLGATPGNAATLNWRIFGGAVLLVLVVAGLVLRDGRLLATAVLLLAYGVWSSDAATAWAVRHAFARYETVGMTLGCGLTLVYIGFPAKFPKWAGVVATALLAGPTMTAFGPTDGVAVSFLAGGLAAGTGILVWRRTRNPLAAIVPFAPLGQTIYLAARPMTGWHFVALSFLLLATGAAASLRKKPVDTDGAEANSVSAAG